MAAVSADGKTVNRALIRHLAMRVSSINQMIAVVQLLTRAGKVRQHASATTVIVRFENMRKRVSCRRSQRLGNERVGFASGWALEQRRKGAGSKPIERRYWVVSLVAKPPLAS